MDAGFIKYLAEKRGFRPGDTIATKQQYDAMYKQYLNDTSGGDSFTPKTGMATNEATGEVTPYFMNSANSAQVLPEGRFKEGPVDKDGTQLVFDPSQGKYFPATNAATGTVVKPKAKSSGFTIGPNGQIIPAGMAEEEPTPTPDPGMTNSMAFQGVPARAAYETNFPTGLSAPNMDGAMGPGPGIGMTPVARATAVGPTNAPAPAGAAGFSSAEEVLAAAQRGQLPPAAAQRILVEQFGYTP